MIIPPPMLPIPVNPAFHPELAKSYPTWAAWIFLGSSIVQLVILVCMLIDAERMHRKWKKEDVERKKS